MPSSAQDPDQLFASVYTELREIAVSLRLFETTAAVQPTSLVHEAWLRLSSGVDFESERHFKAIAARAMRQVLIDRARRQGSLKRGGGWRQVTLTDLGSHSHVVDALALSQALDELEELDHRHAAVVTLRVMGGMNNREIARTLGLSERSVGRAWRQARAWLMVRLSIPSA